MHGFSEIACFFCYSTTLNQRRCDSQLFTKSNRKFMGFYSEVIVCWTLCSLIAQKWAKPSECSSVQTMTLMRGNDKKNQKKLYSESTYE